MSKLQRNTYILSVILIALMSFNSQDYSIHGLTITFKKISEDYIRPDAPIGPMGSRPIEAAEGMKFVKLKLTLKNLGEKDCTFDFKDVYLSTQQDSLYRFLTFQSYFKGTKTKIKPNKELDRIILFEFPDNASPKELFIEDKRYAVKLDN